MASDLTLRSTAFLPGTPIPAQYACPGQTSPPLHWGRAPDGTRSLALIVDDPDAPQQTFVHWVLFNLPPDAEDLPAGVNVGDFFADASAPPVEGANDGGGTGYTPPCPPPGGPHRYFFRLYALDTELDLSTGASKQQVVDAMQGHVLAETELIGTFQRG